MCDAGNALLMARLQARLSLPVQSSYRFADGRSLTCCKLEPSSSQITAQHNLG